jgi:putative endonuclease
VATRSYFVYILSNKSQTLYVGVTNDIVRRVWQHKQQRIEGFTKQYHLTWLVYVEECGDIRDAIAREKQIKRWRREKKLTLIGEQNPAFEDLAADWAVDDEG